MSKQPTLAVVDAPPAEQPLSAAREAVQRAIAWRADATAAVQAAADAHLKAERLVGGPDGAKKRIAEIEAENARIVERWAAAGAVTAPELVGAEELEELRRALSEAERLAAAARAALPGLAQRIENAQASATFALAAVREAVAAVLAEEAEVFVDRIRGLEKQAATLRAEYQASINTLDRYGRAYRFGGNEAQRLRLATPARIEFADAALQGAMGRWATLSEALVTDERATLEAPR